MRAIVCTFVGTTAVLATAGAAQAQASDAPRFYANLAVEFVGLEDFDVGGGDLFPDTTTAVSVRGGAVVTSWLAVEGEYAQGVDNNEDDGIAGYDDRLAGFVRARYAFDQDNPMRGGEVFARLGYGTTDIVGQAVGGEDTRDFEESLDGVAFGVGTAYTFGERGHLQLRLDFTRFTYGSSQNLVTGDDLNSNVLALGVGYQF